MHPFAVLTRLFMFALIAAAALWLTSTLGPWLAIPALAAAVGTLCTSVALLMHRQAPGKVTIINRIAGFTLPWGYTIGRGRLRPIVIMSAICWSLLGLAVIALAPRGLPSLVLNPPASTPAGYQINILIAAPLLISWVVYAFCFIRMLSMQLTRSNPMRPGTLPPMLAMAGLPIASAALVMFGQRAALTWIALALSAGPIVVIGGGYALMLVVMLTGGRNARWN